MRDVMKDPVWASVALALGTLAGCGGGDDADATQVITLGAVVDSSGSAGDGNWANSVTLATDQMNAALSRSGSSIRFRFLVGDSTNTPSVTSSRATEMVQNNAARALITDTSQDQLELLKLQYDADSSKHLDVPIMGMLATSPAFNDPEAINPDPLVQTAFRDPDDWSFRTNMSTAPHGKVIAQIALNHAAARNLNGNGRIKVSLFASNEPYGLGYVRVIKAGLTALAPDTVFETITFPGDTDANDLAFFASSYSKLVDGHNEETGTDDGVPDMLLGLTFPDHAAAIIKAYKQGGQAVPLLFGMALRAGKVLTAAGSDVDGQEGVSPILVEQDASGAAFARDLQAATGLDPQQADSSSYDAAVTLMAAALIAARGQPDPTAVTGAQIRDALRNTSDLSGEVVGAGSEELVKAVALIAAARPINYEGASGPCDFDPSGNSKTRLVRFTVQAGVFHDSEFFDCIGDASCPVMASD